MKQMMDKRYLALPVSAHAQMKKLCIRSADGKLLYDLDIRLDPVGRRFTYYADMGRFSGNEVEISCVPHVACDFSLTDEIPVSLDQPFRPEAHFSAHLGWINDPNGLVLYEGKYHLFFQHNPVGPTWGNMHWGHAVSTDLMHWQELETALFPDETGTMFSGSAIIDRNNVTGLQENEHEPLLLFYTAAGNHSAMSGGAAFTQCMAYSVDGGVTFRKYEKNPVLPHVTGDNRDPKVIWCAEINAFVMALYLQGCEYALYTSVNLLEWSLLQKIDLPGDNECPDFFPLELDGETYWVLSGAHDCYYVGSMKNGRFEPVQEIRQLGASGRSAYAAQTYSDLPDHRRVRISWNTFDLPGMPFNCSMTTPIDLFLVRAQDGKINLCAKPVAEIDCLYGKSASGQGCTDMPGKANDVRVSLPAGESHRFSLFGLEISVDASNNTVCAGKYEMKAETSGGRMNLRIIQDVHSIELFSSDGAGYMCIGHLADESLNRIEGPADMSVEAVELVNYRK